jgi:hypothetical protein
VCSGPVRDNRKVFRLYQNIVLRVSFKISNEKSISYYFKFLIHLSIQCGLLLSDF